MESSKEIYDSNYLSEKVSDMQISEQTKNDNEEIKKNIQ